MKDKPTSRLTLYYLIRKVELIFKKETGLRKIMSTSFHTLFNSFYHYFEGFIRKENFSMYFK